MVGKGSEGLGLKQCLLNAKDNAGDELSTDSMLDLFFWRCE